MSKKRILFCNEASYLSTGFATYGNEVMKRLYATGKYELAELASYGDISDPNETRWANVPWTFIPVMPDYKNDVQKSIYSSNIINEFGEWKFESALLKFRPDIVVDVRDWWMLEFEERSPFRQFYHWAIMPTVDAEPQDEQWIATYLNADAVFSYSDWGLETLRKQSRGRIKTKCSAPPGADLQILKPALDKKAHRTKIGLDPECFIVGTVMRNQGRKLYPDLIKAFVKFLSEAPTEIAKKTYLYLHTSWPDVGWDIPRLIKEAGLGHRCVFTYVCPDCGVSYPLFMQDSKTICRQCGSPRVTFPNTSKFLSREALNDVLNTFDVYVQYANSEGFGMPQVEAAAAGVPVMSVDYSAMSDVVRKLNGYPIAVKALVRESSTHCNRAVPDNDDLAQKLVTFLSLPASIRARKGFEARQGVVKHYTYERTAKIWEDHFDSVIIKPVSQTWESPPRIHQPNTKPPQGLSDEEFVRWGILNVAGRPELLNSYTALRMIRDLNWGISMPNTGGIYFNEMSTQGMRPKFRNFDRNALMNDWMNLAEQKNAWEKRRVAK